VRASAVPQRIGVGIVAHPKLDFIHLMYEQHQ